MSSMNKVILIGRLGQDPETKEVNGSTVAKFSLATSETWKDKDTKEKKERTEWHRCEAWGRQAEVIGQYLKKGSLISVEGQLQTRKWTDKEEVERWTTEIRVSNFKMLGGKNENGDSSTPTSEPVAVGAGDEMDDIPF